MTLSDDVNLEEFVMAKDELSGADIKAVCTEAGLLALRERRMRVTQVGGRRRGVGGVLCAVRRVLSARQAAFQIGSAFKFVGLQPPLFTPPNQHEQPFKIANITINTIPN